MKKITNKLLIMALAAGLIFQSCKQQLDVPPRSELQADLALKTKAGIDAALVSVYAALKPEGFYGRNMFSIPEVMADVAFANGRSSRLLNENRNTANLTHWTDAYRAINEINLALKAIPAVSDATDAQKKTLEGEFKFLRALFYFDLVKAYAYIPTYVVPSQDKGGVVLALTGFDNADSAIGYKPSRAPVADVYAQIMKDLYSTISLLSNTNRGLNFASKHAALALGSRVALYEGKWQRADSFATAAINLPNKIGAMTNTSTYVQGWRSVDHPEAIFQLVYSTVLENIGVNTSLQSTHTTLKATGGFADARLGQGDLVPNAFLIGQLGITGHPFGTNLVATSTTPPTLIYSNDIRNRLFEWGANSSGRYVEVTKWMGKNGARDWDNVAVLRWPELYLNRAEARYHLNDMLGAWNDLNVIRTNRYVGFTVPATQDFTGPALLAEILRQRMLEFAFEGQRFFDLKRYGTTIVKANPVVNMPISDYRILSAIPQSNIDGNPNMVQNFGY
jgi:starch-binding outer membrane protein, SusD/RagB family